MSEDHFKLDVDLESLRAAQRWLGKIGDHTRKEGPKMGAKSAEIKSGWAGPVADKIRGEMTDLGTAVKGFAPDFDSAEAAVKTFADAVETFQSTTLVTYNQKWDTANQNAEDDIAKDESKRGEVANGLRYTLQAIDYNYTEEKKGLITKAKTLGTELGKLTAVPVPDSVATRFVKGGGSGTHISWTDKKGDFPPDLDANSHLGDATLSEDRDQQEAGESAAERFNKGDLTTKEAAELEKLMNSDSEAFRAAFLNDLDPKKLAEFHQTISESGTADNGGKEWGSLLTAISQVMAKGSKAENQKTYAVDSTVLDDVVKAYTDVDDEHDPDAKTKGYLRLSELVAAGQGKPPTWDSDFLAGVTRKTVAYEREQVKDDKYWSWGPAAGEMSWLTKKGADWYGGKLASDSKNPAWGDPLVLLFEAMENDTKAAQQTFTNGTSELDKDLSKYLYGRKAGHAGNYGYMLGKVLEAGTNPKGTGGPGTPEYISAAMVSDMVKYYAEHDLGLRMEESIVNILTNHVEAVNHATDTDAGRIGDVVPGLEGKDLLPYEHLTRPNLVKGDMTALLNKVFGLDYYSNKIAEEGDPPGHDFPLYSQLALAMEISAREEVHYVAKNGDAGDLEALVNSLSASQQRTLNSFTEALKGEGRSADQSNADARAGLDFVLGLAKDQVPTGKGLPSTVAGAGLDKVQELLVDTIIPESDYEAAAAEDVSVEKYRQRLTSLKLVKWLDEAGQLPKENSPQQWAEDHPGEASFVVDGKFTDPGELYRNREADPDAWNDFLRYYENSGRSWMAEIDLDEQYKLGWLEEGG